jgi:tripartite-type tricarboxylate transporter receptor subunit TctC
MKRLVVSIGEANILVCLLVAGCSQAAPAAPTAAPKAAEPTKAAAPAPAPTKAAEPAKAAEPTKAAAAQPTAAPVAKVDFPAKGKNLTFICPLGTGGAMDFLSRLVAVGLEKELGTTVEVVNKSGAGGQQGYTELSNSKPDGYTIGYGSMEAISSFVLDSRRKATFKTDSFVPLAMHTTEPAVIAVRADSPWKDIKDLIDAAKAKPGELRATATGVLAVPHIAGLLFENATGTKVRIGNAESGSSTDALLLGGHADLSFTLAGGAMPQVLSGDFRLLGVYDTQR